MTPVDTPKDERPAFNDELMCVPLHAMYAFALKTMTIEVLGDGCTDMGGAIAFTLRASPDATQILTINEHGYRVAYVNVGHEWHARELTRAGSGLVSDRRKGGLA